MANKFHVGGRESTLKYISKIKPNLINDKILIDQSKLSKYKLFISLIRNNQILVGQYNFVFKILIIFLIIIRKYKDVIILLQSNNLSANEKICIKVCNLLSIKSHVFNTSKILDRGSKYNYISPLKIAENRIIDAQLLKSIPAKDNQKINIGFVGRHDFNKGSDIVLELFEILSKKDKFKCNYYCYGNNSSFNFCFNENFFIEYDNVSEITYPYLGIEFINRQDILLLPYRNLKGTIDPPLLPIEAVLLDVALITNSLSEVGKALSDNEFCFNNNKDLKRFILEEFIEIIDLKKTIKNNALKQKQLLHNFYQEK